MIEQMLSLASGSEVKGQVMFTGRAANPNVVDWEVPDGVVSICVVVIAPAPNVSGVGGGGLAWRNDIPVTPGEVLHIDIGSSTTSDTTLKRGTTILALAKPPAAAIGGLGGKAAWSGNDGGGNGGRGYGTASGGAGGYTGDGGNGGVTAGTAGTPGTGGGGGGSSSLSNAGGRGGGTHPMGQGANGVGGINTAGLLNGGCGSREDGTVRSTAYGAMGGMGCIRIIWGPDRYFPDTGTEDQGFVGKIIEPK